MSASVCREIANGSKHMRKTKIDPKVRWAVVANSGGCRRRARPRLDRRKCREACGRHAGGSFRLGAGELYNLGPFLGFVHDELAELGGRAGQQRGAELGKSRLCLGIS